MYFKLKPQFLGGGDNSICERFRTGEIWREKKSCKKNNASKSFTG